MGVGLLRTGGPDVSGVAFHAPVRTQELELALNEVTPEGARAVAACVAGKAALRRLNLRENELEDEGAVTIAKVGQQAGAWWQAGGRCGVKPEVSNCSKHHSMVAAAFAV